MERGRVGSRNRYAEDPGLDEPASDTCLLCYYILYVIWGPHSRGFFRFLSCSSSVILFLEVFELVQFYVRI